MIREICKDTDFLAKKAELATLEDLPIANDLLETLEYHRDSCVGMAANMIGVCKRIIAVEDGAHYLVMFNPQILKKSDPYTAEEAVFPSPAPAPPSAGARSRCAGRTSGFRSGSRHLPAGRRRLSSTRSTTVTGFSSERPQCRSLARHCCLKKDSGKERYLCSRIKSPS